MKMLFDEEALDMKRCQFVLICLLMISGASADSLDSRLPARAPLTANVATAQLSQSGLSTRWRRGRQATKAKFVGLNADVFRDMRDTSAFVQQQASDARTPSRWLIALAAFGLVVLQLRRKHKSLPQRRIAPYG